MANFETWSDYLYPHEETGGRDVLRNLLDERNPERLAEQEYVRTDARSIELAVAEEQQGEPLIPRTHDAEHLNNIHRHLFQDVYEWAGEYRAVDIAKGLSEFASVNDGSIDKQLQIVHSLVTEQDWSTVDRDQFAERCAEVYAHLNLAHPFREGNGRAGKIFMQHVAEQTPFEIDYDRIPNDEPEKAKRIWNTTSAHTMPDPGTEEVHPEIMVDVFKIVAVERTEPVWPERAPAREQEQEQAHGQNPTQPGEAAGHVDYLRSMRQASFPASQERNGGASASVERSEIPRGGRRGPAADEGYQR